MPTAHYKRVQAFMQKAGQKTPACLTVPDEATRVLRAKLIVEEALETVRALGVRVQAGSGSLDMDTLVFEAAGSVDVEGVADGCADISVVTIGTLVAFGIDDDSLLEEVDRANLRKFGPGAHVRADGKWMKPPDWSPPDIAGVLRGRA